MKPSIVFWLYCFSAAVMYGQSPSNHHVDTFTIERTTNSISVILSKQFIIPSTIVVFLDSVEHQRFSYSSSERSVSVFLDTAAYFPLTVSVLYSYLPLQLKRTYALRTLVFKHDSVNLKNRRAVISENEGAFTNIFGPELSKSGSISRGFLIGSNRDLTLSSGFRLQMAGKLSDDIDIIAALTDENTPIQPQGNTQSLQEIDNVFVEIKSPTYTATLGDFVFQSNKGEFVNISRKLQGAKLSAEYTGMMIKPNLQLTGATSRGKYSTNTMTGIEGVQGPYRLTGKNNERAIIIIPGSERVYVDGIEMLRGENNDYSIDYGAAELTFSTGRLITSASRIVIDFEYSDRQYTRNFLAADSRTDVSKDISLTMNYFREGDDPDAPIDLTLNEEEKNLLRNSGSSTAVKSGVMFVGRDSLGIGKGNYTARDTVVNNDSIRMYVFEQNSIQSVYNVAFSPVGQGKGDYIREGIGRYRFAGRNGGQYAPVVLITAPQQHQLYSFQSVAQPFSDVTISGEYAASNFVPNRFSTVEGHTSSGGAVKLSGRYHPKNISIGGIALGSLDISLHERYKQKEFLSLDRIDAVEFGRKWSTDSLTTGASSDEEIREGRIAYMPVKAVTVAGGFGTLEQKNQFSSVRYDGLFQLNGSSLPSVSYFIESISGEEKVRRITNHWVRQNGKTEYTIKEFTPSLRFENEKRTVNALRSDSLESSSYSFITYAPKLSVNDAFGFDASSEFEWRNDEASAKGYLEPQSTSFTQIYTVQMKEVQNVSASTSVTFREKKYERAFQSNNTNQQATLIKAQTRYRPLSQGLDLDLMYDAATQRTAKLERYFYKVRKGEGQYIWNDNNGNSIADLDDEREFIPDRYDGEYIALTLNSEQLIPIINLKASSRIRIMPRRFIPRPASALEELLTVISTETYLRLEERSTEPDIRKIYLLDFSSFLHPVTTQLGYQYIQQDMYLFEYNPDYSFRFRFNQRNGLSQFASGVERNYSRERSVRSRLQVSNEISNQTDVIFKSDNAVSSSLINRSRQIDHTTLSTDLAYRPETNIEIGFVIATSQAEDRAGSSVVLADFNGQTVRLIYGFIGNGQIRTEFSREEVIIGNQPAGYAIPYELTSGRDFGKNYLWTVSSDYRIAGNMQFSLQYSGRTTSRSTVVHTGRMEVRAYF